MPAARPKKRPYRSPLRQDQAAETRARILESARALVEQSGADTLTLPQVAAAAGVSPPTVYRYFPTVSDLLAAFLEWLRPKIGMTVERLLGGTPAQVVQLPAENYPRFEAHGALLRALNDSPAFNRVRHPSVRDRARRAAEVFRPVAPGWRPPELAAAVGALYALGTPETWRWLRDTWGLDPAGARRAAAWGMHALARALAQGPPSLDPPPLDDRPLPPPRKGARR